MVPTAAAETTIRAARAADFPAVRALLEASDLPRDGVEPEAGEYLVAEAGGEIVGVAGLERHGDAALLRSVAVAASRRGWGIGRDLTTRALERAALAGVRAVYLLTTTAESYFPRLGFRPVGRDAVPAAVRESGEFTTSCPSTAAVMVLELGGGD